MGVRSPDGADLAIQEITHGHLLAGALRVEIHQHDLLLYLLNIAVGHDEGVIRVGVQRKMAHQGQYADVAEGGLIDIYPLSRALGRAVGRTQYLAPLVQIGAQLRAGPGVVAQSYHVRPGLEYGVRLLGRHAHHVGVFAVHHAEIYSVVLLICFQPRLEKFQARLAADVAHGQYFHAHYKYPFANRYIAFLTFNIVPHFTYKEQSVLST